MSTLRFAVLVLAIGCSAPVIAQSGDKGRGACKTDYDKYCAGTPPGGGIVACLKKQLPQLSDACKQALASRKKQ